MTEPTAIVSLIYAAAAEEAGWPEAVLALQRAVGAASSSLWATQGIVNGGLANLGFDTVHGVDFDPADLQAYALHYHRIDPWLQRLQPSLAEEAAFRVTLGESLLPQEAYRRTAFYNELGRRVGLERLVGAIGRLGGAESFHLGLHRPPGREGFGAADVALLEATVPHLRRGLQLRGRLRAVGDQAPIHMLDALPDATLVLDPELGLRHANAAASRLCAAGHGIRLARESGRPGAPLSLHLAGAEEAAQLSVLVRGVALLGTAGGALRLLPGPEGRPHPIALLVSPLPEALRPSGEDGAPGMAPGLALVLLRPLDRAPPPTPLLQDIFGLTTAEAEVAAGLVGGIRAEQLAERRGVSGATIRAQVRAVLEKTGTVNLRELESLLASLPIPEDWAE